VITGQATQRIVVTRDAASTRALAGALAAAARPGDLVSLVGDLGAGKTQFAKGFGAALGITDTIVSPSFVLMAEYRGRLPLFHVDLYRLADAADALAGGLIDDRQVEGVTLVEWAERLADALPAERLDVLIDGSGDEPRRITLRPGTATYSRYLDAVPSGIETTDGDDSSTAPSSEGPR
jgi:tRNA threonylcarbamoyladenosine biosynthesis protein TsaE